MKRNMLCLLLSAAVAIGVLISLTPRARAAEHLKTSEAGIQMIKDLEGFIETPVFDYNQYSVGYGSACEKDDYPNGITEEEADRLLREDVAEMETYLDGFVSKFGLSLRSNQYDALVCFTYNLGPGWMNETSTLRSAITEGKKGNDLIFAMTMWCNAGGSVNSGLVQRRLAEANLYLNGVYSSTPPSNYHYVLFDNNMDNVVDNVKIQGYDANQPDSLRASPSKAGYRFLGWYTKTGGGAWITGVNANTGNVTLYGHWQKDGTPAENGIIASYVRYASVNQKLYDISGGTVQKTYQGGEKLNIMADYMDEYGVKWGRVSTGGWVILSETDEGVSQSEAQKVNLEITVTGDDVNIRKGPGTGYEKVGTASKGQKLTITCVQQGGVYLWGQFSDGWICLAYTDYEQVIADGKEPPEESLPEESVVATFVGIVEGCETLNVYADAGAHAEKSGQLNEGDLVEFYSFAQVGMSRWGQTRKGWVDMRYIRMDGAVRTGMVSGTSVNVRSGPGTGYQKLDALKRGAMVLILETKTVSGTSWGRVGRGWVSMDYIVVTGEAAPKKTGTVGTVTGIELLNVRSGPGSDNTKVATLAEGDNIVVIETRKVGTATWGRFEKGWVHMGYVKLTDTKVPVDAVVRRITADSLRIRSGAGTSFDVVGSYAQGTQVVILEQKTVDSVCWGRTDLGWISMDYVK